MYEIHVTIIADSKIGISSKTENLTEKINLAQRNNVVLVVCPMYVMFGRANL